MNEKERSEQEAEAMRKAMGEELGKLWFLRLASQQELVELGSVPTKRDLLLKRIETRQILHAYTCLRAGLAAGLVLPPAEKIEQPVIEYIQDWKSLGFYLESLAHLKGLEEDLLPVVERVKQIRQREEWMQALRGRLERRTFEVEAFDVVHTLTAKVEAYAVDGSPAIQFYEGFEPWGKFTVFLEDAQLSPGCVWMKGWAENEEWTDSLLARYPDTFKRTGRGQACGHAVAEEVRILF